MSENPMNLNAPSYAWASSTSESDITIAEDNKDEQRIIIYNDTAYIVSVCSGVSSATASLPTSATVPVNCSVIPPGAVYSMMKPAGHAAIGLISAGTDAGKYVYIQCGTGE